MQKDHLFEIENYKLCSSIKAYPYEDTIGIKF